MRTMKRHINGVRAVGLAVAMTMLTVADRASGETNLWVGAATAETTPDEPVALTGQRRLRIAREAETPLVATALAIEGRRNDGESVDQAILVACDLVAIRGGVVERVRQRLAEKLPGFDTSKLILNATHTHTAPVLLEGKYDIPEDQGIMMPAEYVDFLADRVVQAAVEAWEARQRAKVSWGLGHAAVAYNRRVVYADGTAQMYGNADRPDFRQIEGYEDRGIETLVFWDEDDEPIATAINVASPSQQVEGRSELHADFWHPVREKLHDKYGEDFEVVPWTGAAGDQSPHLIFREAAEKRMQRLRDESRTETLARRIVRSWEDTYEAIREDKHAQAPFAHRVREISLTPRQISSEEYRHAKARVEALAQKEGRQWGVRWHRSVVDRYEQQQADEQEPYEMRLHALRLGDVAIATNDFELFTDFGIRIKARSPALQTFLIQLAGPGTYVPSRRAVQGGGYSAIAESNVVGPKGGQELVDHTLRMIESLWDTSADD